MGYACRECGAGYYGPVHCTVCGKTGSMVNRDAAERDQVRRHAARWKALAKRYRSQVGFVWDVANRTGHDYEAARAERDAALAEVERLKADNLFLERGWQRTPQGGWTKPAPFVGYEAEVAALRALVRELVEALSSTDDHREHGDYGDLIDRARAAIGEGGEG